MANPQDVIKAFMASLNNTTLSGAAAVDEAVRACSDFDNAQAVIAQMVADRSSTTADDFLLSYCGINLYNEDTGAITGADAGGSVVKSKDSVIPENGALIPFTGNLFTTNGLTFVLETDFNNLTAKEKFIWQALGTWWAKGALDLIEESYGLNFTNPGIGFNYVTVKFINENSGGLASNAPYIASNGYGYYAYKDDLVINMNYWNYLDETNPNGHSSAEGNYLDETLAHELTHTAMCANILNSTYLPSFIVEGTADLTADVDCRSYGIRNLANDPALLVSNLDLTSMYGTYSRYTYDAGCIFLRYLAKRASTGEELYSNVYTGGDNTITNYTGQPIIFNANAGNLHFGGDSFVVDSSTGSLTILNVSDKIVDIRDSSGNEYIKSYAASTPGVIDRRGVGCFLEIISGAYGGTDIIFAGDNSYSYLWGGSGDAVDAVVGGSGSDTFIGGKYQGSDNFFAVSSDDKVRLDDTNLSDIVGVLEDNGTLLLGFNTGAIISIQSTDTLSAAINLSDGSSLRFNHATKAWQSA